MTGIEQLELDMRDRAPFCRTAATIIQGVCELSDQAAATSPSEHPAMELIDHAQATAIRHLPVDCGLRVERQNESNDITFRCAKIASRACPLALFGTSDRAVAVRLGVTYRQPEA